MPEKAFEFDKNAANFDLVLPITKPVVDGIAEHATGLSDGVSVLDIACGTGEPGLTLLERHAGLQVLGVATTTTGAQPKRGSTRSSRR
jgi:hypothetical protein